MSKPDYPFANREVSWVHFNGRVLQEAENPDLPLYERLAFAAIFSSNLDEFYSVRVAGLRNALRSKKKKRKKLKFDPNEVLTRLRLEITAQQERLGAVLRDDLFPGLEAAGVHLVPFETFTEADIAWSRAWYRREGHKHVEAAVLTEPDAPPPFLTHHALYLATELHGPAADPITGPPLGIVSIPDDELGRWVELPSDPAQPGLRIAYVDDALQAALDLVFPDATIAGAYALKVSRDADLYIDACRDEALGDEFGKRLRKSILSGLDKRDQGVPSRLLYDRAMPAELLQRVQLRFGFDAHDLVPGGRHHNLSDFFALPKPPDSSGLTFEPQPPLAHPDLQLTGDDLFDAIKTRDHLLHLPYQQYAPVLKLLDTAADDPNVQRICVTLYRVAEDSGICHALVRAAENGKQVRVVVELKARFDEAHNLEWAERLEAAGVRVLYTSCELKVHAKLVLITRREPDAPLDGLRRYAILSTGNFNEKTARVYGDMVLFTSDSRLTREVEGVFAGLEDQVPKAPFEHLLVAPNFLRKRIYSLIDLEIARARRGEPAALYFKMNALEDSKMIKRLYKASRAGVRIRLMVRGICRLIAGIPGMSDTIEVRSIVGRYLEHTRAYWFYNGGEPLLYLGSADLMRRNLKRRVEVVFPILDTSLRREIQAFMQVQWADNQKARVLDDTGENRFVRPLPDAPTVNAQDAWYHHLAGTQALPELEPIAEWPPRETPVPTTWLAPESAPARAAESAGPHPPTLETPAPPPPPAAPPTPAAPKKKRKPKKREKTPVPDHYPNAIAVASDKRPNTAFLDDLLPAWLRSVRGVLLLIGGLALLFFLPLLASQCGSIDSSTAPVAPADSSTTTLDGTARYDLTRPTYVLDLNNELAEISGITVLGDELLGAIQDEDGKLYGLDATTGRLLWERKFGSRGDYEDVTLLDSSVYVLRSDGDVFRLDDWTAAETGTTKFETRLKKGCDAEGMVPIPGTRQLLIACKEEPGSGRERVRALFRFDPATGEVAEDPAYLLNRDAIGALLRGGYERDFTARLQQTFNLDAFKPSALAYHPDDGALFVLSSRPPSVAVFEPSGELRNAAILPTNILPQPEGMAFLPDGTLLITTEAAGNVARLVHFAPQR